MRKTRLEKSNKRKSKVRKTIMWICISLIIVIGIVFGVGYSYINSLFKQVNEVEINRENIGITQEIEENLSKYKGDIINIALFGIDAEENEVGRSDSIMIATLDGEHKKLKLTSIMRDSYVSIAGYGNDKINHAYAFGGPELAINTINQNFNLNIKDFVSVNFSSLPKIVDTIGGIELDIDSEELQYINGYIDELNKLNGTNSPHIISTGLQYVDGTQSMAYCRIRYTTGGDYKRTERQREVLSLMFDKISKINVSTLPELLNQILPMIHTSLSTSKIINLGNEVIQMGAPSIEQQRFPLDSYCQSEMINGVYYLSFDKTATIDQIHNYIFEDVITW